MIRLLQKLRPHVQMRVHPPPALAKLQLAMTAFGYCRHCEARDGIKNFGGSKRAEAIHQIRVVQPDKDYTPRHLQNTIVRQTRVDCSKSTSGRLRQIRV